MNIVRPGFDDTAIEDRPIYANLGAARKINVNTGPCTRFCTARNGGGWRPNS